MARHYKTRKQYGCMNPEEKLKLLNMYAWGVSEIQLYFGMCPNRARELRNKVIGSDGTIKFSKRQVVIDSVLRKMGTTREEEIRIQVLMMQASPNDTRRPQVLAKSNGQVVITKHNEELSV